jgi:hypothetical protein
VSTSRLQYSTPSSPRRAGSMNVDRLSQETFSFECAVDMNHCQKRVKSRHMATEVVWRALVIGTARIRCSSPRMRTRLCVFHAQTTVSPPWDHRGRDPFNGTATPGRTANGGLCYCSASAKGLQKAALSLDPAPFCPTSALASRCTLSYFSLSPRSHLLSTLH